MKFRNSHFPLLICATKCFKFSINYSKLLNEINVKLQHLRILAEMDAFNGEVLDEIGIGGGHLAIQHIQKSIHSY